MSRLARIKERADAVETNLTWETGTYLYDGSGNIKQIGADTYKYDAAGRLTHSIVNGVTEEYGYDSFGNLTRAGSVPLGSRLRSFRRDRDELPNR